MHCYVVMLVPCPQYGWELASLLLSEKVGSPTRAAAAVKTGFMELNLSTYSHDKLLWEMASLSDVCFIVKHEQYEF